LFLCDHVSLNLIQKLKDSIPEVRQANDREPRGESNYRGSRGRGRAGAIAARGLAAVGLTKGTPHGRKAEDSSIGVPGGVDGGNA
jgi:hypothetical protein